jgi:hypothetical protein
MVRVGLAVLPSANVPPVRLRQTSLAKRTVASLAKKSLSTLPPQGSGTRRKGKRALLAQKRTQEPAHSTAVHISGSAAPPALPFSTQAGLCYVVRRKTEVHEWGAARVVGFLKVGDLIQVLEERADTGGRTFVRCQQGWVHLSEALHLVDHTAGFAPPSVGRALIRERRRSVVDVLEQISKDEPRCCCWVVADDDEVVATFVTDGPLGVEIDLDSGRIERLHEGLSAEAPSLTKDMVLAEVQGRAVNTATATQSLKEVWRRAAKQRPLALTFRPAPAVACDNDDCLGSGGGGEALGTSPRTAAQAEVLLASERIDGKPALKSGFLSMGGQRRWFELRSGCVLYFFAHEGGSLQGAVCFVEAVVMIVADAGTSGRQCFDIHVSDCLYPRQSFNPSIPRSR